MLIRDTACAATPWQEPTPLFWRWLALAMQMLAPLVLQPVSALSAHQKASIWSWRERFSKAIAR